MALDLASLSAQSAPQPSQEPTVSLRVSERVRTADGVVVFTLVDPSGQELPTWAPGAHIDLILPGIDLVRQYSLCGSPSDRYAWRIAVLLEPNGRGGSRYVHQALKTGATVQIRGPRNHFSLEESDFGLFIAGGIGITPILPMVTSAEADSRNWRLIYGGRSRTSMAFLDELAAYGDKVQIYPQDEVGLLPLAEILGTPRQDCLVYCCGPEALIDAVETYCAGWPEGSLRTERFKAQPMVPEEERAATFEVVCRRSGPTLTILPHESILDVADRAGVPTLSACHEGVCGTCETRVIEGVPEHRDAVLTEDERASGDSMMICVSRADGARLVLDL
ncbi:PDR/VanB family oxidoreductase [Streptomyces purpurogeneiscleroticus]|uniref:PDR/VanB family oxidoreductase n=1 Tax=Streptomyces purpurogeneiscleroticus TaxID=68259 RepID=UPI001CC18E0E|nr:PDR/VanB family oxidoreductase [Streptomyces purpurogeneiscleroticus]MBZ4018698.1 oxidoreductase [Streptomyces purpurogeneiscleroticus]